MTQKGFGVKQYAITMHKLMIKLGYDKYITQGGDWGSFITRTMSHLYPESVLASHLNFFPCIPSLSAIIKHSLITASVLGSYFTDSTSSHLSSLTT